VVLGRRLPGGVSLGAADRRPRLGLSGRRARPHTRIPSHRVVLHVPTLCAVDDPHQPVLPASWLGAAVLDRPRVLDGGRERTGVGVALGGVKTATARASTDRAGPSLRLLEHRRRVVAANPAKGIGRTWKRAARAGRRLVVDTSHRWGILRCNHGRAMSLTSRTPPASASTKATVSPSRLTWSVSLS